MIITRELATKVRDVVAAGLSNGLGKAEPGKMCVEAAVCFALGLPHGDDPGCVNAAMRWLKIRLNDASGWPSNAARAEGLRRLAIAQLGSKDAIDTRDFVCRVAEMTIRIIVPMAMRAAARRNPKHAKSLEAAAVRCEQDGTAGSARNAQRVARGAASAADAADAYVVDAAADAAADAADAAASAAADAYAADAAADAADAAASAAYASAAYAADADADAADAARVNVLNLFAEHVVQILIDLKSPGCEFLDLVPVEAV